MKLSILDLSQLLPCESRHHAMKNSINLAKQADNLGYNRYWLAEHHSTNLFAGRAPEVLIGVIAANTSKIRVGSGAILLNHYSALKVAETFCTLNELFPNRIDLGVGRAMVSTIIDLALSNGDVKENSDQRLAELVNWVNNTFPYHHQYAGAPIITTDNKPPIYILGSSSWSAKSAAIHGLPYVFAGFINPKGAGAIIGEYQKSTRFQPDEKLNHISSTMLALHVLCADTEEEAQVQLCPYILLKKELTAGNYSATLKSPQVALRELGTLPNRERYKQGTGIIPEILIGSQAQVKEELEMIVKDLNLDELIIKDFFADRQAQLKSYQLLASALID